MLDNAQTYTSINDPCRNLGTDGQSSNATVVANCLSLPDVAATAAAGTYNPDTGTVVPGFVYTQPDIQTISGFVTVVTLILKRSLLIQQPLV